MTSSSTGVVVAAKDLTVSIGEKTILKDVSIVCKPGTMTAIMGPSGCGKSTLLNALAGRLGNTAKLDGQVSFDRNPNFGNANSITAYVMQDDYFLEYLTVLETLTFCARLKLKGQSREDQLKMVNTLIEDLSLTSCKDVYVGGRSVKGLSGGQRKRVSIAMALLSNPRVLFLDEPTSGLDASLSFDVIKTVQTLMQKHNKTVVCTIHQPRSQVFSLFDSLLLLRRGEVVFGGTSKGALEFFADMNHPCPQDFNPPDFFLDLLSDASDVLKREGSRIEDQRIEVTMDEGDSFARIFQTTEYAKAYNEEVKKGIKGESDLVTGEFSPRFSAKKAAGPSSNVITDFCSTVWILARRGVCEQKRRPELLRLSIIQSVFMAIINGTIWWQSDFPNFDNPANPCDPIVLRNLSGGIMQLIGLSVFSCFEGGLLTVTRRPLINRESAGGLYVRPAAFVANYIADGCFGYFGTLVYATLLYWMIGLRASAESFFFMLIAALSLRWIYWGYSTWVGVMSPNAVVITAVIPLGAVLTFIVSGFQIVDADIPGWLIWLKAISPARYFFQAIVRSQFKAYPGRIDTCSGYESPSGWWSNMFIALGIGLVIRVTAITLSGLVNTHQGIQA